MERRAVTVLPVATGAVRLEVGLVALYRLKEVVRGLARRTKEVLGGSLEPVFDALARAGVGCRREVEL